MNRFANNLYYLRITQKMSQRELANKLYVSNKTVSKWERGISEPDLDTLSAIADCLDVTVDELVNGNLDGSPIDGEIAPDFVKDEIKGKILSVFAIAGYLLSIMIYLIFSDWKVVMESGIDGKWVGIGVYFVITITCLVLAILLFSSYGTKVKKYRKITYRRTYFKLLFVFASIIVFTAALTGFGQYSLENIKALLLYEFVYAALSAVIVVEICMELYTYFTYRGADVSVTSSFIVSLIQWFGILLSIPLYAAYAGDVARLQVIAPLYSIAGIVVLIAPFIYIVIGKIRLNLRIVAKYLIKAIVLTAITLTPWLLVEIGNALAALIILLCVLVLNTVYKLVVCSRLKRNDVD